MDTPIVFSYLQPPRPRNVYKSLDAELLTRNPPTIDDSCLLESLFLNVSREIARPYNYHLLAPFFFLITPATYGPSHFASAQERTRYCQANTKALHTLAGELRQRLANSPLTVLIVDTTKPRWAAFSSILGRESTIIVEQRLVDVIKLGTPDSRLFGFLVVYHEFAHLIRRWYLCRGIITGVTPKKMIVPGSMKNDHTRGGAGAFAEWAGFGGVAAWNKGSLFLQVKEGLACHVSTEGAQQWWNSTTCPHILEFLTTRALIGHEGEHTMLQNDSFTLPTSPPTCFSTPLGSPSPTSTSTSPTQLTSLSSYQPSLLPSLNMSSSPSRSPKTPKTRTRRYKPYNSPTSAAITVMWDQPANREGGVALTHSTYVERLSENLHTMQKAYGEEDHEWLERVVDKSAVEDRHFRLCHFDFGGDGMCCR